MCPQRGDEDCSRPSQTMLRLAARPVRLLNVSLDNGCPTSSGYRFSNAGFSGIGLGKRTHPVHPVVAVSKPSLAMRGTLALRPTPQGRWWVVKTAWFARPRYRGPWLVRGTRLDKEGPVRFGENPTTPMMAVGRAAAKTADVFRSVPGGTFVLAPGCYGWQVDGVGFSYHIVFQARRALGRGVAAPRMTGLVASPAEVG